MSGQIQSIVARIERLEDEKKTISTDIAEIYKEAKLSGFDVKVLRKVIAKRKKSAVERSEEDAMIDVYMASLGMVPDKENEISRCDGVTVTYSRAKAKPVDGLASATGAAVEVGESHSTAAIQIEDGRTFDREVGKSLTHETTDAGPSVAETQQRIAVKSVETDNIQTEQSDTSRCVATEAAGASPGALNPAAAFDGDLTIPGFLKRAKQNYTTGQILAATIQVTAAG